MCSFNCDNGGVQNLSFQDFFLNCTRFFFHCWRGGWFPTWSTQCRRPRIFIDFLNSLPLLPLVELHFSFFTSFNFLFTFLSWLFLFYWDFYEQALSNSINPLHQYSFHSSLSRWTRVHLKVGNRMYIHIPFIKLKLVPNQFFFRIFFPDWIHPTAIYIYFFRSMHHSKVHSEPNFHLSFKMQNLHRAISSMLQSTVSLCDWILIPLIRTEWLSRRS